MASRKTAPPPTRTQNRSSARKSSAVDDPAKTIGASHHLVKNSTRGDAAQPAAQKRGQR